MAVVEAFQRVLERPTMVGVCTEMVMLLGPIWIAFVVGVLVGWAWKPKWANLGENNNLDWFSSTSSKSLEKKLSLLSSSPAEKGPSISLSGFDGGRY